MKVWDIRMVQEICQVDTGDAIALGCAFDKNSKLVSVACSDTEIKVVNIEKGEVVNTLKSHEDSVNGIVVNQDNTSMYSISSDGSIRTWK